MKDLRKIKDLFEQALERSGEEREDFLSESCGGDSDLRAKVERLLSAHLEAEQMVENSDDLEKEELVEGGVIGPFELRRVVGQGGQGVVFLAQQTEPVRRPVALKFLKTGTSDSEFLARFNIERQTLAALEHPNIARVYDAGTSAAGKPWIAMEWVEGKPITTYCRENSLSVSERLDLMRQTCGAIQHAHRRGILHRDLKPGNVLVTEVEGKPEVKVIDFGIAKALTDEVAMETTLTRPGMVFGTPAYISPEQARLTPGGVDTRSDVFSLGVMLFELLTGTTPLERKRIRKMGLDELLQVICDEEPPDLSVRFRSAPLEQQKEMTERMEVKSNDLLRQFRQDLNWIARRALEKDPDRRYESPRALAEDLGRFQKDLPVEAGPPSIRYRAGKWVKRRRSEVIAAALIFAVLCAGGVVAFNYWQQYRSEREIREGREELGLFTLDRSLIQIRDLENALKRATAGSEGDAVLDEMIAALDRKEMGEFFALEAINRVIAGKCLALRGRRREAETQLLKAIASSEAEIPQSPDQIGDSMENRNSLTWPTLLEAQEWLAWVYLADGRLREAREVAEKVRFRYTGYRFWGDRMLAVIQWSDWFARQGMSRVHPGFLRLVDHVESRQEHRNFGPFSSMKLVEMLSEQQLDFLGQNSRATNDAELWRVRVDLARAAGFQYRYEEGVSMMTGAIGFFEEQGESFENEAVAAKLDLATIHSSNRKLEEAAGILEQTLEEHGEISTPDPIVIDQALFDLAFVFTLQGRDRDADAIRERLLKLWTERSAGARR